MQVFKCAMRIIRGNIVFPIIYIIGLSFMGVFMAQSFDFGSLEGSIDQKSTEYSIVDRDDSDLSHSIAGFLEERGVEVRIEDSRIAFQDAVAKGQTDYLLVIPEGYERDFRDAVLDGRSGDGFPQMDVVFSYYSSKGSLMDEMVNAYLGVVRTLILESPNASMDSILFDAFGISGNRADIHMVEVGSGVSEADRFAFYMQWSTYTLFAGIVVCVGMLISTMNRADVRRRNLSSPLGYLSYNLQLALACAVFAFISCAWSFLLGLAMFPEAVSTMTPEGMALVALSVMAYSFMALSFGFMLGQFGASDLACNAFGNIFGMVISFFGGAWISLDLLTPEIVAAAHWLPGFWYTDACQLAVHVTGSDLSPITTIMTDVGVLALFAVAFLGIGFVAAKRRLQTSEAGGNRAAEVVAT